MESYANNGPTFGDLTNLGVEKLQELDTVLKTILALPIAQDIYAQIIDGNPTHPVYPNEKTSSVSGNLKPTDRAFQEYEKIRRTFASQDLLIDLKLAQDYQNTTLGSRENLLRLLQMTAASVHALAGKIYLDYHPNIDIKPPKPPEGHNHQFNGTGEFYVNFYHASYMEFKRYPFGLLDIVGYWAETELFGGLVLFEREEFGSNIINVFLHPQKAFNTYQLSETQIEHFAGLKEKGNSAETVLPFAKEADARTELTVVRAGEAPLRIYKNEYDKPAVSYWPARPSCVVRQGDPGAASFDKAMETIKEKGWDKAPRTAPFSQFLPPLFSAYPTTDESSSSSKDDPNPSRDQKNQ